MTDVEALKRKLAALQMLCPTRPQGLKQYWEMEVGDETIVMRDVEMDGQDKPVTLYTIFNPDISSDTLDAFAGNVMDRTEAEVLVDVEGDKRAVSLCPTPTRALQALALGGGIEEGTWLCHCEGGGRIVEKLPKGGVGKDKANQAIARMVARLSILAMAMLIRQAGDYYIKGSMTEVVEEAGKSPSSADEKSAPAAGPHSQIS